MTRDALGTIASGGFAALMGAWCVLMGAGVIHTDAPAEAPRWVIMVAGGLFVAGGVAAALTTASGRIAKAIVGALAMAIVAGFAAIGGWIAFGPGERAFGSPFVVFGPKVNEAAGRIAFGLGAALCGLILVLMLTRWVRAASGALRKPDA